jgi:hypothetical protein
MLTTYQIDSIRDWAQSGALRAEAVLRESHTPDSGLEIRDLRCTPLCELPERVQCFDGQSIAGVVARFNGALSGSVLFAMEPADALAWVNAKPNCDAPIDAFLGLASEIQSRLVVAIGEGLGIAIELEPANLREDSVPGILFGTHAPSDTAILCFGALVAAGDHLLPLYIYVMLDPKSLGCALSH